MRTKSRKGRRRQRRSAFTLLEVLMVIVILGILAAVIVPNLVGTGEKAKRDLTASQISGLGTSLDTFQMHCGRYPTSDEGLAALMVQPDDETLEGKWAGPYLKRAPKDAWGRDLQYEFPGEFNTNSYDLSSAGPDGEFGGEDDIANWEKT